MPQWKFTGMSHFAICPVPERMWRSICTHINGDWCVNAVTMPSWFDQSLIIWHSVRESSCNMAGSNCNISGVNASLSSMTSVRRPICTRFSQLKLMPAKLSPRIRWARNSTGSPWLPRFCHWSKMGCRKSILDNSIGSESCCSSNWAIWVALEPHWAKLNVWRLRYDQSVVRKAALT